MPKTKKGQAVSCRLAQDDTLDDFDPFGSEEKKSPGDPYGNLQAKCKIMTAGYRQYPRAVSRMTEIGLAAKAVISCLLDYVQNYGDGRCFPSLETVAGEVGISKNTARRAVRELLAKPRDGQAPGRLKEPFLTRTLNHNGLYDYTINIPDWVIDKYGRVVKKTTDERFRDKILEKCKGKCAYCGRDLEGYWEADHVIPKKQGGSYQLKNRVAACRACNEAKGEKTAAEFGHPELMPDVRIPIMGAQTGKGLPKMGSRKIPIMGPELEGTGTTSTRKEVALPTVGQTPRPDPSSLLDSASKASDLSDKAKAKHQSRERKWDKDMEVEKANWKASINSWKGEKFYAYMLHLCQRYGVKVNDPVELSSSVPARFARAMNDTLKMLSVRQVSNEHWARVLERLISEWNQGGSDIMGKKGGISVYGFRYKLDEVLDAFRDRQPVKTKPGAKTTPTVSVKEFFGVVQKKED